MCVCVCVCVITSLCSGLFLCTVMQYTGSVGVLFLCLIGCFSITVWTPTVFGGSYMHAFSIFVFAPVQRN